MNIDKYTEKAKTIIANASSVAVQNQTEEITDLHLMLSLIENQDNIVYQLLVNDIGVDIDSLINLLQEAANKGEKVDKPSAMRFAEVTNNILNNSEKQAENMRDEKVSVEHIMLAILEKGSRGILGIFKFFGINKSSFSGTLKKARGNAEIKSGISENKNEVLEQYGKDITEMARQNLLDPVIGRDEEIRNVIRILTRKTKNNPCLIGEPGVGKTAIVEGLAQRIIRGDVPNSLKGKTIFSLDLGLLIAGAKYRGEFEERLQSVLDELEDAGGKILLFIDEVHQLVGAGKLDGAMDASNLLKPKLARRRIALYGSNYS